jgi:hypothetical protein
MVLVFVSPNKFIIKIYVVTTNLMILIIWSNLKMPEPREARFFYFGTKGVVIKYIDA